MARIRTGDKYDEKRRGADKSGERSKSTRWSKSSESDQDNADMKTIKEKSLP